MASADAQPKRHPLRSIMGVSIDKIKRPERDPSRPYSRDVSEIEQKELAAKVEDAFLKFVTMEPDHVLDSMDELTIRGVAKKAGLPVTETKPNVINVAFVEKVKAAISANDTALDETPDADTNANQGATQDENQNPDADAKDTEDESPSEEINEPAAPLSEDDQILANIDKLHSIFLGLRPKDVLESYPDIEIRGVARKAGLPVTETKPKKLTHQYVTSIQNQIRKNNEIKDLGNNENND